MGIVGEERALYARGAPVSKLRVFLLVLTVITLNAAGNLALAWGMRHIGEAMSFNPAGYVRAILNPFVALGIVLLVLWMLTRMALLSWADLSLVLPLTGLGYILAAALGRLFLNESITASHWLGTLLIFSGAAMAGSTDRRTHAGREVSR